MPAYSFNPRFVPMVLDGTKRQTIRARRKYPAKVGDTLYLFSGLRTKYCTILRQEKCVKAVTIMITNFNIYLFSERITNEEYDRLRFYDINKIEHNSSLLKVFPSEGYFLHLSSLAKRQLAWNDGFRPEGSSYIDPKDSFDLMKRYFAQTKELPFIGDIIYW